MKYSNIGLIPLQAAPTLGLRYPNGWKHSNAIKGIHQMRPERKARFLERIRCAGGVAFVLHDLRDVLRALGEAQGP